MNDPLGIYTVAHGKNESKDYIRGASDQFLADRKKVEELFTHSQNREADIRKEERANIKRKIDKVINDPETTAEIRVGLGIACGFVRWYGEKNSDTPITKDNLK